MSDFICQAGADFINPNLTFVMIYCIQKSKPVSKPLALRLQWNAASGSSLPHLCNEVPASLKGHIPIHLYLRSMA